MHGFRSLAIEPVVQSLARDAEHLWQACHGASEARLDHLHQLGIQRWLGGLGRWHHYEEGLIADLQKVHAAIVVATLDATGTRPADHGQRLGSRRTRRMHRRNRTIASAGRQIRKSKISESGHTSPQTLNACSVTAALNAAL